MTNLKPCPYRHVDDEGHILCDKIKSGDREVAPNICRACPVSAINCAHLRATLDHQARPPITVRYGNGKTEIWDDPAPSIALARAACAVKVMPIHSQRDCLGCALRQSLAQAQPADARPQTAGIKHQKSVRAPRVLPAPAPIGQVAPGSIAPAALLNAQPAAQVAAPTADARSTIVHQKIIQLQEWLAKQKNTKESEDENTVMPIAVGERRARPVLREEKRVGWTD